MPDDGPIQFVKPENPPGLSSLVRPGVGMVFSGRSRDTQITLSDPPVPVVRSSSDATGRILSLLSLTFARLSIEARKCIARSRERQSAICGMEGVPRSAKIPYEPLPITDESRAVFLLYVDTISALFGDGPAFYAREKFVKAAETGDMRAFKIRLLFIKVRDSIKGCPMHAEFVRGMEDAITESERMAGCKPDNSPRRLSKAEKERKIRIQEKLEAKKRMQPELPLEWPDPCDIDRVLDPYEDCILNHDGPGQNESCEQDINMADENASQDNKNIKIQYIENCPKKRNPFSSITEKNINKENKIVEDDFTVKCDPKNAFTVKKYSEKKDPVRKARNYETVEQILDDIESGAIVRYESVDEVKSDLKEGKITLVESLMFAAALDRYCESDMEGMDAEVNDEIGDDIDDGYYEEDAEDEYGEDADDYEDYGDHRSRRSRPSFSYNPNGFAGTCYDYSDSEDW